MGGAELLIVLAVLGLIGFVTWCVCKYQPWR